MPALNYEQRFAALVESGAKRMTIRRRRKYPIRAGDKLYHYTGMRSSKCRLLMVAECVEEREICLTPNGVKIDGCAIPPRLISELLTADGFETIEEFRTFFSERYELPFYGQIICW